MKIVRLFLCSLMFSLMFVGTAKGENPDRFVYDAETGKILCMGPQDVKFEERLSMEKRPDTIMRTGIADQYLSMYLPEFTGKAKDAKSGQITVFNKITGRTEDILDFGYGPFVFNYSSDRLHYYIAYKKTPEKDCLYELLHYDVEKKTSEIFPLNSREINGIAISPEGNRIYALIARDKKIKGDGGKVLVFSPSPLTLHATIPTGFNPLYLYPLGSSRAVLVDGEIAYYSIKGSISLVTENNSISFKHEFKKASMIQFPHFDENRTIVTAVDGEDRIILKITPNSIQKFEGVKKQIKLEYSPESDQAYILSNNSFTVADFRNNKVSHCDTGMNRTAEEFPYTFYRVPGTNRCVIYCPQGGGSAKVIDLETNSLVRKTSYGRSSAKFGNALGNLLVNAALYGATGNIVGNVFKSSVAVATNNDFSRYYILNTATRDITIFDETFTKPVDYIVPKSSPLGIFLLEKPHALTFVVTKTDISRLDYETAALFPFHQFIEEVNHVSFIEEEGRFFIITDKEIIVMDSATLRIKNKFFLFGNPDDKYTRLKKGEQRYYFITSY